MIPIEAKFDSEISLFLTEYVWHVHHSGKKKYLRGYKKGDSEGKRIYFHHLLLPKKYGFETDHINGDGLDNRRENLRYVTRSLNNHNRRGVKGYYFDSWSNKWKAELWVNFKKYSLGRFKLKKDARLAYIKGKKRFGLFNFHMEEET